MTKVAKTNQRSRSSVPWILFIYFFIISGNWDIAAGNWREGVLESAVCWAPDIGILGGPRNRAISYRPLTYVDTRGTWTTCLPVTFYLLRFTR